MVSETERSYYQYQADNGNPSALPICYNCKTYVNRLRFISLCYPEDHNCGINRNEFFVGLRSFINRGVNKGKIVLDKMIPNKYQVRCSPDMLTLEQVTNETTGEFIQAQGKFIINKDKIPTGLKLPHIEKKIPYLVFTFIENITPPQVVTRAKIKGINDMIKGNHKGKLEYIFVADNYF